MLAASARETGRLREAPRSVASRAARRPRAVLRRQDRYAVAGVTGAGRGTVPRLILLYTMT
jgi:hypothetical protein